MIINNVNKERDSRGLNTNNSGRGSQIGNTGYSNKFLQKGNNKKICLAWGRQSHY